MMVSGGYPGNYEKEKNISGLTGIFDSMIFHAGTKQDGPTYVTAGGRVLCVTSYGKNTDKALEKSYDNVKKIGYENAYYRTDIGFDLEEEDDAKK
jgi:phosphoribosylamine--glycine ligase